MDELLVEAIIRTGTTAWRKQAARDVIYRILLAHTLGTRARHTLSLRPEAHEFNAIQRVP